MVKISEAGAHASAALTDRMPASKDGTKGYLTVGKIKERIDPVIAHTTVASLKAVDAAADCHDGEKRLVYGFTTFGDIKQPFLVQWDADATGTDDELLVFRPSTGAASSGAGRWVRPNPDQTVTFADADNTPSVKNRTFFKTANASASISNFDDGYKGQNIVVERGAIDAVIAHNSNIDCGGRSLRLTASFPRAQFYKDDAGVWRLLTPRETVLSVKEFGAKGDGRVFRGVTTTSGSPTVNVTGGDFTSADVGKVLWVEYGAGGGAPLKTTIAAVVDTDTVTAAANAGATVSNVNAVVKVGTDDTTAIDEAIAALNPNGQRLFFPHGTYLYSGTSGLILGDGDATAPSTKQNIELVGEVGGTYEVLLDNVQGTAIEYIGATVATYMVDAQVARVSIQNLVFNGTRRVETIWNLEHVFWGHFHMCGALYPEAGGIGVYQGAYHDAASIFVGSGGNVFNQVFSSTAGALGCVALQVGQDAFTAGFDPATTRFNFCQFTVSDDTNASSWTAFNRVPTATTSTCILLRFTDNISFDGCFTYVSGERRGNGVLIKPPSGSGNAPVFPTQIRMSGCHHVGGIWVDNTDNTWNPDAGDGVVRGLIIVGGHWGDASDPSYDGACLPPFNITGVAGFTDAGEFFGAFARPKLYSGVAATPAAQLTNNTDAASVLGLIVEGDRATPANNDNVYVDYRLSDGAGNQDVIARQLFYITDITSGAEYGVMRTSLRLNGTLTGMLDLTTTRLVPVTNDALALGSATLSFADLFLASGGVINWNNGDVTLTHASNSLAGAGGQFLWTYDAAAATSPFRSTNTFDAATVVGFQIDGDRATPTNGDGVYFDFRLSNLSGTQTSIGRIIVFGTTLTGGAEVGEMRFSLVSAGAMTAMMNLTTSRLVPVTNDGLALGSTALSWADLFLASGGVINFNAGNVTLTHSAGKLAINAPFQLPSYTVAGVPAASIGAGSLIYVSNESGGATTAFSDGTNWRRCHDRAIIS